MPHDIITQMKRCGSEHDIYVLSILMKSYLNPKLNTRKRKNDVIWTSRDVASELNKHSLAQDIYLTSISMKSYSDLKLYSRKLDKDRRHVTSFIYWKAVA